MGNTLNREDYRRIKNYSKVEMEKWLDYHQSMMYNILRKEFEQNYQDELNSSVSNFLVAIWYTLHFSDEVNLSNDELSSFMEDLYASVDMFRKGEYKPEEYAEEMKQDGVQFSPFDYTKLYNECEEKYKSKLETANDKISKIKEYIGNPENTNKETVFGDILNIIDGGV